MSASKEELAEFTDYMGKLIPVLDLMNERKEFHKNQPYTERDINCPACGKTGALTIQWAGPRAARAHCKTRGCVRFIS